MGGFDARQYIETQRLDWNRVAPAWQRWDFLLDRNLAFINYRLIGDARLRAGQRVLDLGCGTGYPALLAAQAVGEQGCVIGLDLAEEMLAVARRKAASLGLLNVAFHAADVTTLAFEPASFDAVISRFCLMFIPDIAGAVREIARVLKPGGYLAAAVWSKADKNPFIRIPADVIGALIPIPPPSPDQPGLFRLARPGDLLRIAEQHGLVGVEDVELEGDTPFLSADEYFENLMDVAAPLHGLFAKLTPEQRKEAEAGIKTAAESYRRGSEIALPTTVRLIVARRPL